MATRGTLQEDEFVYFLDGKKAKDLSDNLKSMMRALYGIVDDNKVVRCIKTEDYIKPDIVIRHRREEKAVSIKYGKSHVVHSEHIKSFILSLRELGLSERTQKTILYFFYGDKTMDGTGEKRYPVKELCQMMGGRIKEACLELNKDVEFIKKVVNRLIFQGVNPEARPADAIYHGDINSGILLKKEQIMKYIDSKKWQRDDNNLHIGPIYLCASARYVNKPIASEKKHHRIVCYWPRIVDDFYYIAKRYDGYVTPYTKRTK